MMTVIVNYNSTQTYDARRRCGGFLRHSVETMLPDGTTAAFSAGVLRGTGTISTSAAVYNVGRSAICDESGDVAEYSIDHRFMQLTIARLADLVHCRRYVLRQQRSWSSNLVMLEDDIQVGLFQSGLLQSRYRISVSHDVSCHAVLACVWISMIRGAFGA
ncbi:MAG: hypothetical protein R3C59_24785 [Planctomycetaceae bacterium]